MLTGRVALASPSLRCQAASRRSCVVTCVARPTAAKRVDSTQSKVKDMAVATTTTALAPWLVTLPAFAAGGEYGLLEGRTAALIHPAVMASLLAATLYAGWLGFQYRRSRTLVDDIKGLKAQLPSKDAEGNYTSAVPQGLESQIASLEEERKALVKGGYREKHWNFGSVLLAFGVAIAIEGAVNTYMRTGKLFPGPHLFAGAGIVVLWAAAASLVPAMQKGNESARTAHIALNMANVGLFLWQVPTGWEIVGKVFQFTSWP